MTLRHWLALSGLTFSAFIFNTSEFVPIGLLTDIKEDFHLTEASVGMLISVYAWVVMLLSLPLMIMVSRMEMRRLMLWLIGLFGVCQVMSYLSGSYAMLMASRIGVACTHAIFWSIVAPMAVRMAPEKHKALALSMVVTGSSVAMVLGMPLGRMIGLHLGWRMTFLSIAVISALIFVFIAAVFPRLQSRGKFSFAKIPALLHNRVLLGLFVLALLFATTHYTGYSYIEPFLDQVAGLSPDVVTMVLIVFGASGMLGSIAFSKYYMSGRRRFMFVVTLGPALCLLLMQAAAMDIIAIFGVCIVWGAMATAFNIACQDNTIRFAPKEATSIAMSIFSGIFNLGIGCGAYLGGVVVDHTSLCGIGYAGALIGLVATLYLVLRFFPNMRRREAAQQ